MAAAPLQGLCEEATCSICLEDFRDPVITECGHNFCRACLTLYWEGLKDRELACPQCRAKVLRSLVSNRQLANFVELTKKLRLQEETIAERKGGACGKHREPLKLFCKDDEAPICVVCKWSKEHREHQVVPLEEAAQDYKDLISSRLKLLEEEKAKILTYKAKIEEESQGLLDVRNLLQSPKNKEPFQNPVAFPPELRCEIRDVRDRNLFLAEMMKQFRDSLLPGSRLQKANVTLDPMTANPCLFLSEDRKSVRYEFRWQDLPDNPERFNNQLYVLGCEGFRAGRHYWEVTVGSEGNWAVGVARKSVRRKGFVEWITKEGIWALGRWRSKYRASNLSVETCLSLSEKLRRIQVSLNYEGGQVSFHDADTGSHLYTFSGASFSGETLLPFFHVAGRGPITISP
ncbi:zinc finger protein RFP isoform X9 [Pogona vitticeps]